MVDLQHTALGLLERLHGALGDELAHLQFLAALERALSPGARVLLGAAANQHHASLLAGPAVGVVRMDFSELMAELQHPAAVDYPVGGVLPLTATSGVFHTRFYAEMLAPAGIRPGPGLVVLLARSERQIVSAIIVVPGRPGWAPSPADHELMERLAPHLVIARRLQVSLSRVQREEEALVSTLDRLSLGIVFTDSKGGLSYANRSAAELIGHPPGFSERDAVLDDYTCAWRDLLVHRSQSSVFIRAPDDGRLVQVLDTPIDWDEDRLASSYFAHAFLISDPKQNAGDPSDVLCEQFDLTRGEARLAVALLSDRSLKEAAKELGITEATARSVLKCVFAKTGARRQSELVRMLVRGATGQIRARRATPRSTAQGTARRSRARASRGAGS